MLLIINTESKNCIKSIDVIYDFIIEVIKNRVIEINQIPGPITLTNILTKGLLVLEVKKY